MEKKKYDKHPVRNRDIRALVALSGVRYGDIAKEIHVSDSTLNQWLRVDLKEWQRKEIIEAIRTLVNRGEQDEEVISKESEYWNGVLNRVLGTYMAHGMGGSVDKTVGV